jgi:thiamine biosynthesis protein ThiI
MTVNKFISLISGGFDSPLAAALMIKRGFIPIFLSFLTSDDKMHSMKNKVIKIIKKLKSLTKNPIKVYLIDFDNTLNVLKKNCQRKLTCVLCKRLMLRIARVIGLRENTNIIVTGDILGEQASQTLDNLFSYNDIAKDFVILRPLITYDKKEVIEAIRELGLYDLISQPSATCLFNPQYPETHAKLKEVLLSENKISLEDLIKRSIKNAEILNL